MEIAGDRCYRRHMMSDLRQARGVFAKWLLALAMIAVVQQSAIPRGYMLDRSANGQLAVVLCTSQGSITRWLDLESGELTETPDEGQSGNTAQHCAFATAASLAALPDLASLVLPLAAQITVPPAPVATDTLARQQARPPARAPPATL